jgi:ergothioneine biosynthesis protein EgtB
MITPSEYLSVRRASERLCAPLAPEDYVVQAMPDVSPAKWHLAHVSWFFETFVLEPYWPGYRPLNPTYRTLFNSYYRAIGPQYPRPARGHLSRPTVIEIYAYRRHVDHHVIELLSGGLARERPEVVQLIELGCHHEQQHQELLLTDIKYNFGINPLQPAYCDRRLPRGESPRPSRWIEYDGGVYDVGHEGKSFSFDNERPRHHVYVSPYRLAARPVTNGEYLAFLEAGGYRDWQWWLADGWTAVQERGWTAPLYWERRDGGWSVHTLCGPQPLDEHAPVCHVSYYEADAYARWRGARLPTEHEWEHAVAGEAVRGHFAEHGWFHPLAAEDRAVRLQQAFGDVWEWTRSAYAPYPGFQPQEGAIAEYNGKFMANQFVLRGGSCVSPASHIRPSYRNFFPADARWQFSGIRLAGDA